MNHNCENDIYIYNAMRTFYYLILFAGISLFTDHCFGQRINVLDKYQIYNYNNDEFNSTIQIWDGEQLNNGSYVFGNDKKLLHFDGEDWTHISNQLEDTIQEGYNKVFSIFKSSDEQIYIGKKSMFGKLIYDSLGRTLFQPIISDSSLSDIWSIYETNNKEIVFTTLKDIVVYNADQHTFTTHNLSEKHGDIDLENSVQVGNGMLITFSKVIDVNKRKEKFVYHFDFNTLQFHQLNTKIDVRASYNINNKIFVVDFEGSVFKYNKKEQKLIHKNTLSYQQNEIRVNQILLKQDILWVATENHGVITFNKNGIMIRSISSLDGLQDNNVFRMFFDNAENLWLALDNGISVINLNTPLSFYANEDGIDGAVETFINMGDSLFMLASRSGVFISERERENIIFKNTNTIEEAAYDIKRFQTDYGERIAVVGYNGIYDVTEYAEKAKVMATSIYGWELTPSPFKANQLFIGGENFIGRFTFTPEQTWKFEKIKETSADIIKFAFHNNLLYFSVKGEGIFTINKQDKIEKVNLAEGLNISSSHFYLETHQSNVYAGYNQGLLKLNENKQQFEEIFPIGLDGKKFDLNFHRLYSHPSTNELIAVVFNETPNNNSKHVGFIEKSDTTYRWRPLAINVLKNGIIYDISANEKNIFFALNTGFASLNRSNLDKTNKKWNVYISKIEVNNTPLIYNASESDALQPVKHGRSIRFEVRGDRFFGNNKIQYRFRLKGISDRWSNYESNSFKIYDQLPAGTYTLEFQGINQYTTESEIGSYTFVILPPWYLTWWAYLLYVILFVLIIYLVTKVSIYRIKQKNKSLENIVNERTKEIAEKNKTLEHQKNEISEINSDLLGSINYAKRIQNTILPSKTNLDNMFKSYFVLYLPKDIVSGDFYWAQKFDEQLIWAAVDCTGHGVPGAFVSIVGNNTLIRATKEFGLRNPAKILDKQRELVIEAFKNEGHQHVKDGMDLALVALNPKTLQLEYAGANNPLVIVRNKEIIEFKADKQPIGEFVKMKPFTNQTIQLQTGDCIYLYSDGFVDQFGGDKNKKFKSKPFKKLLCEISHLPMEQQHKALKEALDNWRGDQAQVDDICIFGVRI
ncbi:hypothetical protein CW751_00825 [Brumimicrobium salinarum]|uniref:PPM-type phosphatase domain-containing protein n=1 Tax=Brumimicrobium salinarum TaxID=2058658 RepID=A0A2I0R5P8_9FLAO|nr:SpoIIE family protein phosphatase [Brumimicrobium salinarum]PKR81912.1 hypothetical protein CW751_00825 [Brumimicrobium salinarum]